MRTRFLNVHKASKDQVRASVFWMRRGPMRRGVLRMLNCRNCGGVGSLYIQLGRGALQVDCHVCHNGRTASEIDAQRAADAA